MVEWKKAEPPRVGQPNDKKFNDQRWIINHLRDQLKESWVHLFWTERSSIWLGHKQGKEALSFLRRGKLTRSLNRMGKLLQVQPF